MALKWPAASTQSIPVTSAVIAFLTVIFTHFASFIPSGA
ncbi:hypothetical protein L581_3035 [Serratia fonticola AU-AP2C]|nr:hypothetical protein L581_3035 [Serratia fonticola AU-AP2C]